jgi:hypothetical protein
MLCLELHAMMWRWEEADGSLLVSTAIVPVSVSIEVLGPVFCIQQYPSISLLLSYHQIQSVLDYGSRLLPCGTPKATPKMYTR